ncbi:7561_t:CDS:2, partial [Gigaspora rosea]
MGDVLPFINIGVGFSRRGHEVIIAANARFKELIESKGFEFREIKWDMIHEWEHTDAGKISVFNLNLCTLDIKLSNFFVQESEWLDILQYVYSNIFLSLNLKSDAENALKGVDFVLLGTGSTYMYPE